MQKYVPPNFKRQIHNAFDNPKQCSFSEPKLKTTLKASSSNQTQENPV